MRSSPGALTLGTIELLYRRETDEAEAACAWWCETAHAWRKANEEK